MALLTLDADGQTVTAASDAMADQPLVGLEEWLSDARPDGVGVRLLAGQGPEDWGPSLAQDLGVVPVIALDFPKFADGRSYSVARKLRSQYGYRGRLRAVGDVLIDQIPLMVRCGFDEFSPADGTDAAQATAALAKYGHVYQGASDGQTPVWQMRAAAAGTAS